MADIFLSYRRSDSQSATGRLADRLVGHFGSSRVFLDHESIVAGEDFPGAIRRAMAGSVVVLAIIGPEWLDARDADGGRRLDDQGDFVRLEIESAFDAGLPIIPILIEDAVMPAAEHLPPSLARLSFCNAVSLSAARWNGDVDGLIETLQSRFGIESERPSVAGGVVAGSTLDGLAGLALDLLELTAHPTRLIVRRQTGHVGDHLRAFGFLVCALLLGNLAFLVGAGMSSLASWITIGIIFGVIVVTVFAALLTIAWRAVGERIEFRQVTLILAYILGGGWLWFCTGALLVVMGVQLIAPDTFNEYLTIFREKLPIAERLAGASQLLEKAVHGPSAALIALAGLIWLAAVAWVIVAWGGFRISFGCGRVKAFGATSLFLFALGSLFAAARWIAVNVA